ncbi:MAG: hypothetical protein ACYCPO_08770 [Acidobacteriaceae bacterium]
MKRPNLQRRMVQTALAFSFACGSLPVFAAHAPRGNGETIVMIRHGEKPSPGLGQLDCKGLNRALALPPLLIGRFGKPDFLYAPDPAAQIHDGPGGAMDSYVRPLATIEPTAIRLGMPVNTQIGFDQIAELQQAMLQSAYAHSLIFVAWEHYNLRRFAEQMLQTYGDGAAKLPAWPGWDYGTIYVFHIARPDGGGKPHATLEIQQENLGSKLTNTCPGPQ